MREDRDKYIKLFKEEAREYLERLNGVLIEMEENPTSIEIITEAFRIFHTLKGMTASLGFKEIESISHVPQIVIDDFRAIISSVYLEFTGGEEFVLCVETIFHFKDPDKELKAYLLLIPNIGGLTSILKAMDLL